MRVGSGLANSTLGASGLGALAGDLDPTSLAEKLAREYGKNPEALAKLREALAKKKNRTEKEQQLLDLIDLIIEAAKSGNLGALTNSLNNGALGNLSRGLLGSNRSLGGCFNNRGGGVDFSNMKPWSESDKEFLGKALTQDSEHFSDQIRAWAQGQEGNCASVATIKAAMDRFDNKVFDSVERTADGGYQLRMQDGHELNLSPQELSMAKTASNFRGEEGPAKSYAQLCYAAMAKRALQDGHEGSRNYAQSLWSLNNGENPVYTAKLLGLRDRVVSLNPYTLNNQDSVVAWSQRHAVFVNRDGSGRHTADHYGRGTWFNGGDTNGWSLVGAFTFKPRDQVPAGRPLGVLGASGPPLRELGATSWTPRVSDLFGS